MSQLNNFAGMGARLGIAFAALLMPIEGAIIASGSISAGMAQPGNLPPQLWVRIAIASNPSGPCEALTCYEIANHMYTPLDIGSTVTITPLNNPAFDAIVGLLTDGIDSWISGLGELTGPVPATGGGFARRESTMFQLNPGPDFEGYSIAAIHLRLDRLVFDTVLLPDVTIPFPDLKLIPHTSGIADFTLSVEGVAPIAAPEPASIVLACIGLATVALNSRRFRLADTASHIQ